MRRLGLAVRKARKGSNAARWSGKAAKDVDHSFATLPLAPEDRLRLRMLMRAGAAIGRVVLLAR